MKTTTPTTRKRGYVSVLLVLSTGTILSLLTIFAYRRAIDAQTYQSQIQLRVDYSEKEEAILRSIVAVTPNRAMRAMQAESNTTANSPALSWESIFKESLDLANARTSISTQLATKMNISAVKTGNSGDSALANPGEIFRAISPETGWVSVGNNRSLGTGFPPPLSVADTNVHTRDFTYPIISDKKSYGTLAQSGVGLSVNNYYNFNLLKYPQINFGYGTPGENFVAKRNWWAFSVDVGDGDDDKTFLARNKRNFVLSIYEIPSQLSISAASFMSLGQYASGDSWQKVNIDGGIFASKAEVKDGADIPTLSSRRGMTLGTTSKVGGKTFSSNPFAAGAREKYMAEQATSGAFYPVSLASESGRAAFIPINRGAAFFDRYSSTENDPRDATGARNHTASNVLALTSWNNYSIGAQQCAMRMDITKVVSATNRTPTEIRFEYYRVNGTRGVDTIQLDAGTTGTLPPGFVKVADENQSYTFSSAVDLAYGASGGYSFLLNRSGTITYNNATFGDPLVGTVKSGYWRPKMPYTRQVLANGQTCISVNPERIPAYLASLNDNAAPVGPPTVSGPFGYTGQTPTTYYNNSIAVNVDYVTTTGAQAPTKPNIPCTATDYGVMLKECSNLTPYTRGFSLVTNLRLFIGDDFNTVAATPPSGYTPAVTASNPSGRYMPPCSLFAPEKRYGVDVNPFAVNLGGQIGSLSKVDKLNAADADTAAVRPLDSKNMSGTAISAANITVNLSQIRHPAELPPISMMNWLVLLEERRKEYH